MQFVFPAFLFALAALAIPIILHLFYFRRFKKVYFTNVRFLKEVKEETSARSKLRNLLILAMRLLALLFLVLAFAQPFIPQQNTEVKAGEKAISIFLDNSFSMEGESEDVPLIDKAKQRAREIIQAYGVADRFQILTHDFEGRHQRMLSKEDALLLVDEIELSPQVRKLSAVLSRQVAALSEDDSDNRTAYIISDFQKSITDLEQYTDTTLEVNLIPLQSVQERNISIDSAWFESPVQMLQQSNQLFIKVSNWGETDAENVRVSILYEGQNKPVGTINVAARSSAIDTANITILRTGWHEVELSISDYPIQFDDKYFISFYVAEKINILAINDDGPNAFLEAALGGVNHISLVNQNYTNLDYSTFKGYQLIILNDLKDLSTGLALELQQFVNNGGNLLLFPGAGANLASYAGFLNSFQANVPLSFEESTREVGYINTEEFIFNDVFENKDENLQLPVTTGNYKFSAYSGLKEEALLRYRDGSPYLTKYQNGQGHLYLCVSPLDESRNNLVRNAEIFVPLLYKAAISTGQRKPIAYTIGADQVLEVNHTSGSGEMVYHISGQGKEFIPEQRIANGKVFIDLYNKQLQTGSQITQAGFYELYLQKENTVAEYAFNFDRLESNLQVLNTSELGQLENPRFNIIDMASNAVLTAAIEERSQGVVLWRWCIILMLVFLGLEILLLRLWKAR